MILMHENIPVADLSIYLGNITAVNQIYHPERLPIGIQPGPLIVNLLSAWQRDRAIPIKRESLSLYNEYFKTSVLEAAQTSGFLSLTDHYWMKEEKDATVWEDVCFQLNGFSNHFGDYFLSKLGTNGHFIEQNQSDLLIPDITTDGMLQKIWLHTDSGPKLFKFGDYGNNLNCNLLSANEIIASQIAEMVHIKAVKYNIAYLPGIEVPVCVCPCFVSPEEELVTAQQIMKAHIGENKNLYDILIEMGFKTELQNMLKMILLLHNKDCHNKNYGLIRNATTLEITGFAPLFDQGSSLCFDQDESDVFVKPFKQNRWDQMEMIEDFHNFPLESEVNHIIQKVYSQFHVPEIQLQLTLHDLHLTYQQIIRLLERRNKSMYFVKEKESDEHEM